MTPRRNQPRSFPLIASTCALGMATTLTLGACGLETIAAPEEAMEALPEAMDSNETIESSQGTAVPGHETAEVPTATADGAPEGSSGATSFLCRWPSRIPAADWPLIIVDGERTEPCFDEIFALDIESFELARGAAVVHLYGGDGQNSVMIVTTKSGGDGKGPGTPGSRPTSGWRPAPRS